VLGSVPPLIATALVLAVVVAIVGVIAWIRRWPAAHCT
jgi:hypothetical protein